MADRVQSMESMKDIRRQTVEQWEATGEKEGSAAFSISESGKIGAAKKLIGEDLPAIVTNDPDHLGEAFMGSYNVKYDIRGTDPDGSLVVQYTLDNTTSSESALHFIGYYDWLRHAETLDGPMMSAVSQTVTYRTHPWDESVNAVVRPLGGPGVRGRLVVGGLVLSAVTALVAGCSEDAGRCGPAPVEDVFRSDLYGTYEGPHGARLTLRDNGDNTVGFAVTDWPESGDPEILDKKTAAFDGDGTWRIDGGPGKGDRIGLQFEDGRPERAGTPVDQLQVGRRDGHIVLFDQLGDPDVCRVFELTRSP